jgi:HK97 family phage major capsid protein
MKNLREKRGRKRYMKLSDLGAARETLLQEARGIIDADSLDDAKRERLDAIAARVDEIDTDIEVIQRLSAYEIANAKPLDSADTQHRRDRRDFSITAALRAAIGRALPTDDTGFEREVQQEMRRTASYEGFPVPMEALETRAPIYTSTTSSPNLIATEHRPDMYVPALRDSLVASALGVRTMSGLQGNLEIPTADGVTSASWVAESGAFDETTPTFGQLTMTPRKLGAWSEYGYQMVLQSSPGIEGLIRNDLTQSMALALDNAVIYGGLSKNTSAGSGVVPYAALTGSGDIQPHGLIRSLMNTSGVVQPETRSGDANGAALTFAALEALPELLDSRNVPMDSRAWLLSTREKYNLMGLPRFATDGDRSAELAYRDGRILGDRAVVSNMVDTTEHHGTGSGNKSSIFYGNWSDMLIGYWDGLDIMTNPYAGAQFKRATILIRSMLWADILVRRELSFAYYDAVV